jgi:hypothetical protein
VNEALLLVVLAWAGLLIVPSAVRSRNASPHATVGGFTRAMDVLRSETRSGSSRSEGRRLLVPSDAGRIVDREIDLRDDPPPYRREDPVIERRRVWFLRLVIASAGSLLLAAVIGGWLWTIFALTAGVTVGYVALMRRLKLQRDEARRVVRELDLTRLEHEPAARVAVGGEDVAPSTVRLRRWDD